MAECVAGVRGLFTDCWLASLTCVWGAACVAGDLLEKSRAKPRRFSLSREQAVQQHAADPFIRVESLPEPWQERLSDGQLFTACILCTSYSEKYHGRLLQAGSSAQVRLPQTPSASHFAGGSLRFSREGSISSTCTASRERSTSVQRNQNMERQGSGNNLLRKSTAAAPAKVVHPKLFGRAGFREAVAFVWLGDQDADDDNIYVSFSMMRRFQQAKKIIWQELSRDAQADPKTWEGMAVGTYCRQKVDKLWDVYGLAQVLDNVTLAYPDRPMIFSGVSHGGTLAQVSAVRYILKQRALGKEAKAFACTWNGYRWTDEAGVELIESLMGWKMLPIVLSRWEPGLHGADGHRVWDTVSEMPSVLEPLRTTMLQDIDNGVFWRREEGVSEWMGRAYFSWLGFKRLWRLHYAQAAIAAMRKATQHEFAAKEEAEEHELDVVNSKAGPNDVSEVASLKVNES
eukprot:TRINITY_DN6162_c0_g1_i1.p1 TRINITY_DN6162_c0_g1~~TRINITY_DN6162_c0_g1_i1.p1  ORF type:complete len:457 (+),score=94.36 TRINITY_DN6162_c0_g1_i1:63-1433(+)